MDTQLQVPLHGRCLVTTAAGLETPGLPPEWRSTWAWLLQERAQVLRAQLLRAFVKLPGNKHLFLSYLTLPLLGLPFYPA